jgi:hypothetical protein
MLSADAMRLAAIEVLTPYPALQAGSGFPTLAGRMVFDSRAATVGELDGDKAYTPALSLYTGTAKAVLRSDAAEIDDTESEAVLEIIAELAVAAKQDGEEFSDALAADDPEARMVLSALTSQVIFHLCHSQAGHLFRRFILNVRKIEVEQQALPQLGLRWQRNTIRITCGLLGESYDIDAGGLPEPIRSLAGQLPAGSYARIKLDQLGAHFVADPRPELEMVAIGPVPEGDDEFQPISSANLED